MTRGGAVWIAGALLCSLAAAARPAAPVAERPPLAEAIRPRPDELKWLRIPWVLDLTEARRQAAAERRPLFLWAAGDDPLERC